MEALIETDSQPRPLTGLDAVMADIIDSAALLRSLKLRTDRGGIDNMNDAWHECSVLIETALEKLNRAHTTADLLSLEQSD